MSPALTATLLLLAIVIIAIAVWLVSLNFAASRLLRRRQPDPVDPPSNYGIDYEEVHFMSRDGIKVVGWWIPVDKPISTIVMCHGQNGSMDGDTRQMPPLHEAGFNVLMFDFRAHGRSEGESVTMGMYEKEDLLGALDYLTDVRGIKQVGVLGFSMGAATALIAAALSDRICAVVADSSFGRLKHTLIAYATSRGVPHFIAQPFVSWMLGIASVRTEGRLDQTDPTRWTVHIGPRPLFFIQGEDDRLVSMRDLDRMISLAQGPVDVWIVDNVGHRGAYNANPMEYNTRVVNWFKQVLA